MASIKRIKRYLDKLETIARSTDTEAAHGDADRVLCDLLNELGYTDIVREYNAIGKWYA